MGTVETSQKQKSQQYQLAKGALTNLQRKQQWVRTPDIAHPFQGKPLYAFAPRRC